MVILQEALASLRDCVRPIKEDECVNGTIVFLYEGHRLHRARMEQAPPRLTGTSVLYVSLIINS